MAALLLCCRQRPPGYRKAGRRHDPVLHVGDSELSVLGPVEDVQVELFLYGFCVQRPQASFSNGLAVVP